MLPRNAAAAATLRPCSYQNATNPPIALGIPASHFDAPHYWIRWHRHFRNSDTAVVYRAYCPIGDVTPQPDGSYRVTRGGMPTVEYTHFGSAVAHLMVVTS